MNPALADHLVEFLRREKPVLRELPIPAYVNRLLEEIEAAGFSVRKKSDKFTPSAETSRRYLAKLDAWKKNFDHEAFRAAFPHHDIAGELEKAHLWLKLRAAEGAYRTRFNQFFQNWIARNKPTVLPAAVPPKPKTLGDERDEYIAQGIRELAASRSEKLYPTEFEFRFSVAKRDLEDIPTVHLPEAFRRARMLDMRTTPGVFHVLTAYKAMKTEKLKQAEHKSQSQIDAEVQAEEERKARMTPEERAAEADRIYRSLQAAQVRHV